MGQDLSNLDRDQPYAVILPCSQSDFGAFVSGLLGKAQTIERTFVGTFEITPHDIENVFHLLDQRIRQQDEATLVQFTIKLLYGDRSSVLINSIDDFLRYNEVRPLVSVGAHLSWVYLIRFLDKTFPEKQQIEISISCQGRDVPFGTHVVFETHVDRMVTFASRSSISVRISHSARSWGIDIESLLTGYIESLLKVESKFKEFICNRSGEIGFTVGALFFLTILFGAYLSVDRFVQRQMASAQSLLSSESGAQNLIEKVNFLIESAAKGAWPRFQYAVVLFVLASLVSAIFLGFWVGSRADNRPQSFLLLTKKAEELRDNYLAKRRRDWFIFGLSVIAGLATGITANILFSIFSAR